MGILPSHIRRGPCQRTKAEKLLEGGQDVKYHEHIEGGHPLQISDHRNPLCGLSEVVPSARRGPKADKEWSRTVLGRMGENEKHRGHYRRQAFVSMCRPSHVTCKITKTRWGRSSVHNVTPSRICLLYKET